MRTSGALPDELAQVAARLREARQSKRPIEPPTAALPHLGVDDAYAIASHNVHIELAAGARIVGYKIGLTSRAAQEQFGVSEPDYGVLLDTTQIDDGAIIDRSELILPRFELELALSLRERLSGPHVTAADVRDATECVIPAIELVDSRVVDWRTTLADTIADGASSARFVLGSPRLSIDDIDVTNVEVELWHGDELRERGNSSVAGGDPCAAVAWLANALTQFGEVLDAGHIVLAGSCTSPVSVNAGDAFTGRFASLGEVSLNFAPPAAH
jgi:2-keto-4-pentenoate hydratase